jgi:DNA excision repair protein ERCC-2
VEEIILQRGQLLAEAPTGTGKTISVLFPALKALLASGAKKIFYLTAKTIGRKTVLDTMVLLQKQGLELRTIALTAKSKICPCPDRVCSPKACKYAKGFFDRIDSAIEDILEHNIFDRRLIVEFSRLHQVCPFELSLELAEHSDLIICDFNYVFAPSVYLKRFFDFNPEDFILLIDEGHNLVARGRNMFSASISKEEVLRTRRKLKGYNQAIYRALGRLNRELLSWRKKCEKLEDQDKKGVILAEAIPDSILDKVGKTLAVFENEFMDYTKPKPKKDPRRITARNYYFELLKFIKINSIKGKEHVFYLEKEGRELKARLFCRDPAPFLAERYSQIHSSVIFSATLAPLEYFRNSLGILPESTSQVLSSPFPRKNFLLLVNDRIRMTYKYRRQEIPRVVDSILAMTAGKTGNYIIYFPSYGYMDKVLQVLRKQAPGLDLLVQKPGMSESRREDFLAEFIANKSKTLLGCAVMGGIFSEGIDLSGDRLIGAAVLTVSLPGISLERNLIRDYFDEKYNKGFQFAYKYPGFNRVLQAAGRVIRSNKDRGVVFLIDQRFGKAHYRRHYPEHWKEYRRVRRSYELESACRLFWQED